MEAEISKDAVKDNLEPLANGTKIKRALLGFFPMWDEIPKSEAALRLVRAGIAENGLDGKELLDSMVGEYVGYGKTSYLNIEDLGKSYGIRACWNLGYIANKIEDLCTDLASRIKPNKKPLKPFSLIM